MKKVFSILVLFAMCVSLLTTLSMGNPLYSSPFEKPIPLGAEVDLVEGLSDADKKAAIKAYDNRIANERQKLNNILYNFQQSIDDKYFGGAYWEGDTRETQELYILVTDYSIVPKEIKNEKINFKEVKYSQAELFDFIGIIEKHFLKSGLSGIYANEKSNKIVIEFLEGFDVKQISGIIPDDSYEYSFVKEHASSSSTITVANGAQLSYIDSLGNYHYGSTGLPVMWGSNKGWLTAGHFVKKMVKT